MRIESLLSARLFLAPRLAGGRLYFESDLSGRLCLYAMEARPGGSVPEPLMPPSIALQNPHLLESHPFAVFPELAKIVVMLDQDGDENYQPMAIPLGGGFPEPAFGDQLASYRVRMTRADRARSLVYLAAESRREAVNRAYRGDVASGRLELLGESKWGSIPVAHSADHARVILADGYTAGDVVLFEWRAGHGTGKREILHGTPLESRKAGHEYPLSGFGACEYVPGDRGLLVVSALHSDHYSLGYLDLANPAAIERVKVSGIVHTGAGELVAIEHLAADRFTVGYNIDGCSWLYEGRFDEADRSMTLDRVICGMGALTHGVLESASYDHASESHALSFSTATTPTQIYSVDGGPGRHTPDAYTRERVLGLPAEWLAAGEDASFTSHDGLRISARLYLPAPARGARGPHPLVYYVHGGPQSQERPDFAWFSMPLIQFLTLNGFAVFVPNARGSTGYGLSYMKRVDRDWGGLDRLDHVHAMTAILPRDQRLDVKRAGVIGRSYGGYMTLTLASRHPELWAAVVDMFGPYDLTTFMSRIPETWKPYFAIAVGDPVKDRDFLRERSPATYMEKIACPLLVIQGQNDPRVIEQESRDVAARLRALGKTVDYLVFADEGHDVLKYQNKVTCYNTITEFFTRHLRP
jgi:pimeloyl-ACP methyl ester carboxylesterase